MKDMFPIDQDLRLHDRGAGPLQPCRMHRREEGTGHRQARSEAHQHQLRRAREPLHPHGQPSPKPADERFQQEGREPRTRDRDLLHALQFRPHSPDATLHACNGGWRHNEALGTGGYGRRAGRVGGGRE